MPQDIFDFVGGPTATPQPSGDIFDQVAASSPTATAVADTGEGDGFLAKINAALRKPSPDWLQAPEQVARETITGRIPHDVPSYLESIYPPAAMAHRAVDVGEQLAQGDVSGVPFVGRVPEIIAAEDTPAGSVERYRTARNTLMDLGLLAGGGEAEPTAAAIKRTSPEATLAEKPMVPGTPSGAEPPPTEPPPPIPPESDPNVTEAMRVTSPFKRWWERFWPRDLAVTKVAPDSPVITAHQALIKGDLDYMENFAQQPWWRAIRKLPNEDLIDIEHQAVNQYRGLVAMGTEPKAAYETAVSHMPEDVQALIRHRESRLPIEQQASTELGVDAPKITSDPYIARLTNEEGKDVVDLHPRIMNLGRQLRTTIGSFDNSRVHPTMKDGIAAGTQYEPVGRAVWLRELASARLEEAAKLLRTLKGTVLFDTPQEALAASPRGKISQVRGLGPSTYYARTPEEAVFLEQNIQSGSRSPFGRLQQIINTYVRNPSLVNPLPHVTKNMLFKYVLARVGSARFKFDAREFTNPTALRARFDKVMPFPETSHRLPQLTAREVGSWGERAMTAGLKINNPSSNFIFAKADPAMRYSLWKSYVRKGMSDQEAANHVWLDLIRYDANSGGMNFWKSIPFNFFVPWRTGTYVTLAKAFTRAPIRTALFIGAVEYLREIRYRKTGRWTHLPVDYIDAPLSETINQATKVKDVRTGVKAAEGAAATAATTALFGPGGGQAPNTIRDVMQAVQGDPGNQQRVLNMFWGLSQIYGMPREFQAYRRDGDEQHLVNLLTAAAVGEHSTLKYEPRRLMKWLPESLPGMQRSPLVKEAEGLQAKLEATREKAQATYEARRGVGRTFHMAPEEQQLEELKRATGQREQTRPQSVSQKIRAQKAAEARKRKELLQGVP